MRTEIDSRTARTGHLVKDSQNWTGRKILPLWDFQDRTTRTELQERAARIGLPAQDSKYRTVRAEHKGGDSQKRIGIQDI